MKVEQYASWSPRLSQEMTLRVYGDAGKPVLVFPSQGGQFFEYEDFGMVEVCRPFVEEGRISLVTVDSVDGQSWTNQAIPPAERALRHNAYEAYVVNEVVPFARSRFPGAETLFTTGCSMGAYHAANFFFRHPDVFDGVIALSGLYQLSLFIGDYMDENVYFNSPLSYLPSLEDPWYLERYRRSRIFVCTGQGAWEEDMVRDTRALEAILRAKEIPALVDFWGEDVAHDWPWWRRQMPHFLSRIGV